MPFEKPQIPIDGDNVDIDYVPTNYTPDATGTEAIDDFRLAAHLNGINEAIKLPTAEGQILYAATSSAFIQALPLVNSSGFLLVNDNGNLVVK